MEEGAIPLCLPDNYSWDERTNRCIKLRENRSSYKPVANALRRLEAIQGPLCVVAVAGPLRQGKSFILSQLFEGNREIFPLGHSMIPETVGLWMWVVPEKYLDGAGNELTVVLIDSEGIDSSDVDKRDDDTILTLAVLLSSVLIYNSAGVPKRSDLEALRFVGKLSQRVQVLTGQETTSVQAQMVFPSFIWLLRDVMQSIPKDCKDLTDYFRKHVFVSTTSKPEESKDKAKHVTDTLLNFFPSFQGFSLPFPSCDPEIMQTITHQSSQGALNPKFLLGIKRFSRKLKSNLRPKTTPDGIHVTGQALSSMVESYVQTLNTTGCVPSISGAWKQYIGKEALEIYQIANAIYLNAIEGYLEGRLPCDPQEIRDLHTYVTKDVGENVFEAAMQRGEICAKDLAEYREKFQTESQYIRCNWLQRNQKLTKQYSENVFKKVEQEYVKPVKDTRKNFENQGEAELRIRCAYDTALDEFKTRCNGCCKETVAFLATLYEKELNKAMEWDIAVVRNLGTKRDEKYARETEKKDCKDMLESIEAVNIVLKDEIESISQKVKKLGPQYQNDLRKIEQQNKARLLRQRRSLESRLQRNEAIARREIAGIRENVQRLESRREELQQALNESEKILNGLEYRSRHRIRRVGNLSTGFEVL